MSLNAPLPHLVPYLDAAAKHGGGFGSLLWASPKSQQARFAAIRGAVDFEGLGILDAGCGRADFLGHLLAQGVKPREYIGLEAVEALAQTAEARGYPSTRILRGDFVREPLRMFVGSDAIVFSGSLNTLDDERFYTTLGHAFVAASEVVVFNFLSSPALAGRQYLFWRCPAAVAEFGRTLTPCVEVHDDYMPGDCTVVFRKV